MNTKLHAVADSIRRLIWFFITSGQVRLTDRCDAKVTMAAAKISVSPFAKKIDWPTDNFVDTAVAFRNLALARYSHPLSTCRDTFRACRLLRELM